MSYRKGVLTGVTVALLFLAGWYSHSLYQFYEGVVSENGGPNTSDAIKGLGYLSGYEEHTGETGVTRRTPAAWEGYNLVVSGHDYSPKKTPTAYLMDNTGDILHEWHLPRRKVFSDTDVRQDKFADLMTTDEFQLRRAKVSRSGNLYGIFQNLGIVKIDRNSNILWSKMNYAHHDLYFQKDNELVFLGREPKGYKIHAKRTEHIILDDTIEIVTRGGKHRRTISIADAIKRSRYPGLLSVSSRRPDIFHTNTVNPGRSEGTFVISMKYLSTIATIDRKKKVLTDPLVGITEFQHDPMYLENGNLLVFDNNKVRGQSRVVEIDPESESIDWQYGQRDDQSFYSACCGTVQPLPNGNVLISITNSGRAVEIDRSGDIVWEYYNPTTTNEGKIGAIYQVRRYPKSYFEWLEPSSEGGVRRN